MNEKPRLILASRSPRRQELLRQIGVRFTPLAVDICENVRKNELPEAYVARLAAEKARCALDRLGDEDDRIALGADTVVVLDNNIMGKPADREEAIKMLRSLSGTSHQVLTAVTLSDRRRTEQRLCQTTVWFRNLNEDEIARYWETGEPVDKAGGYGIQGKGGIFVDKIDGCYSTVVGLPLWETCKLLEIFSIPWWCHP